VLVSLDPAVASEYKALSLDVLRPEARISLVDKDGNPILPAEERIAGEVGYDAAQLIVGGDVPDRCGR